MSEHDDDTDATRERYETPDIEDVWAAPETLLDPNQPPPPLTCTCGAVHEWKWWGGRIIRGLTVRPRWCPVEIDPCIKCSFQREQRAEEQELDRRQQIVGIAPAHRGYRWHRWEPQRPHEPWGDFARRIRGSKGLIGVCLADLRTSTTIREWNPHAGGIYLSGPVGSGKSLWVSARLTALVAPTHGSSLELSVDQLLQRGVNRTMAERMVDAKTNVFVTPSGAQKHDCLLIDEEEVVRRVELSWKGDQVPLLRIARVPVLAYDDIGTVLVGGGPKARDLARICLDRLIDLRWRESRPMLVTSNRTLDEICDAMSRRTADRLRELCATEVAMQGVPHADVEQGFSWRRLPPQVEAL